AGRSVQRRPTGQPGCRTSPSAAPRVYPAFDRWTSRLSRQRRKPTGQSPGRGPHPRSVRGRARGAAIVPVVAESSAVPCLSTHVGELAHDPLCGYQSDKQQERQRIPEEDLLPLAEGRRGGDDVVRHAVQILLAIKFAAAGL